EESRPAAAAPRLLEKVLTAARCGRSLKRFRRSACSMVPSLFLPQGTSAFSHGHKTAIPLRSAHYVNPPPPEAPTSPFVLHRTSPQEEAAIVRRNSWVLLLTLLVPHASSALQLRWSSGATDLSFSSATRCTLVVQADSAETRLPSEWRLLWVADSLSIQF